MKKLFFFVLFCMPFQLFSADLFWSKIRISRTSDKNSQDAKLKAMDSAREQALFFTISKLIHKDYSQKVDKLLSDIPAYTFEKNFSVAKEAIADKRYSAEILYVFDEKKILNFLYTNSIPYTMVNLGNFLVIPSYYYKDVLVEGSPWDQYWRENNTKFLSSFIYYDNRDVAYNKNEIAEIKQNIDLTDIYLLDLSLQDNDKYSLKITKVSDSAFKVINNIESLQQGFMIAIIEIEDEYKKAIIESYSKANLEKVFTVDTSQVADFVFIEQMLAKSPDIISFQPIEIGYKNLQIKIKYKTDLITFEKNMASMCVVVDVSKLSLSKNAECSR